MKIRSLISTVVILAAILPVSAATSDDVEPLMKSHRRQLGGFDAAASFFTARLTWTVVQDGEAAGEAIESFGENTFYRVDNRNGRQGTGMTFDGTTAFSINVSTGHARSPHGAEGTGLDFLYYHRTRAAALLFPLLYAERQGVTLSPGDKTTGANVIVADFPDGAKKHFILGSTNLIEEETYTASNGTDKIMITREYSGYRSVRSAMLPHKVTETLEARIRQSGEFRTINSTRVLTLVDVENNITFESDYFSPGFPIRPVAGREIPVGRMTFVYAGEIPTGDDPESIRSADLNEDGNMDLVTGDDGGVSLLLGDGTGAFPQRLILPGGGGSNEFALPVDLNADGIPDLAVASTGVPGETLFLELGAGKGLFREPVAIKTGDFPESIAAADFDGDSIVDLAVAHNRSGNAWVHFGDGKGNIDKSIILNLGGRGENVAQADLNADGLPDLLLVDQKVLTVFVNAGNRSFAAGVEYKAGPFPFCVAVADFTGDGNVDVVVGNGGIFQDCGDRDVALLRGNGDGTLAKPVFFPAGGSITWLEPVDLDGDGAIDLAASSFGTHEAWILKGTGKSLNPLGPLPCSWSPAALTAADFNGDGVPDLAVANEYADSITIWLGKK